CRGQEDGFFEGPDPFGGLSVASTSTYQDQGTKQKGTIHVVRDITERRAAEQKYRSLFEQVQEGAFVASPTGTLLDRNDALGFLLDVTEKKHAEDEIRRRNRELNALNAMAVIATQSFDLDEILNLTLRQVISVLGAESGSVYLAESQSNFRRRANWGQRLTDRKRLAEVNFPNGLGDLVMRSRAEVLTSEYLPHLPQAVTEFVKAANFG